MNQRERKKVYKSRRNGDRRMTREWEEKRGETREGSSGVGDVSSTRGKGEGRRMLMLKLMLISIINKSGELEATTRVTMK